MSFIIPFPPLPTDRRHYCHLANPVLLLFFPVPFSKGFCKSCKKQVSSASTYRQVSAVFKRQLWKENNLHSKLIKKIAEARNQKKEAGKWSAEIQLFLLPPYLYLDFSANFSRFFSCCCFISFKHHSICKHNHFQYFSLTHLRSLMLDQNIFVFPPALQIQAGINGSSE